MSVNVRVFFWVSVSGLLTRRLCRRLQDPMSNYGHQLAIIRVRAVKPSLPPETNESLPANPSLTNESDRVLWDGTCAVHNINPVSWLQGTPDRVRRPLIITKQSRGHLDLPSFLESQVCVDSRLSWRRSLEFYSQPCFTHPTSAAARLLQLTHTGHSHKQHLLCRARQQASSTDIHFFKYERVKSATLSIITEAYIYITFSGLGLNLNLFILPESIYSSI